MLFRSAANNKTYGDGDPSPLTTGSGANFVAADGVTASYSRAAGEMVAGRPYLRAAPVTWVQAYALAIYIITNTGADFTINKRPATWTTAANNKTYGDGRSEERRAGKDANFVAAEGETASYSRAAGETVAGSPYHITATLSSTVANALANY